MLDRSGAGEISSNDLKIEWYKLGTDFAFAVRERLSSMMMSGLDENFDDSLKLARNLIEKPNVSDETWNETKKIILSERDDEEKDPRAISHALAHFHRYGEKSRYLNRQRTAISIPPMLNPYPNCCPLLLIQKELCSITVPSPRRK